MQLQCGRRSEAILRLWQKARSGLLASLILPAIMRASHFIYYPVRWAMRTLRARACISSSNQEQEQRSNQLLSLPASSSPSPLEQSSQQLRACRGLWGGELFTKLPFAPLLSNLVFPCRQTQKASKTKHKTSAGSQGSCCWGSKAEEEGQDEDNTARHQPGRQRQLLLC